MLIYVRSSEVRQLDIGLYVTIVTLTCIGDRIIIVTSTFVGHLLWWPCVWVPTQQV
jgi:hypothetical protein